MTLEEAIAHALEVAEKNDGEAEIYDLLAKNHNNSYEKLTASRFYTDCAECAADHRQLAEWLKELKDLREKYREVVMEGEILNADYTEQVALNEQYKKREEQYKRLLKAAVEDIVWLNEHTVDGEGGCLIETATDMETCLACPLNVDNSHLCGWKHQAEALKLIGGKNNAP